MRLKEINHLAIPRHAMRPGYSVLLMLASHVGITGSWVVLYLDGRAATMLA